MISPHEFLTWLQSSSTFSHQTTHDFNNGAGLNTGDILTFPAWTSEVLFYFDQNLIAAYLLIDVMDACIKNEHHNQQLQLGYNHVVMWFDSSSLNDCGKYVGK